MKRTLVLASLVLAAACGNDTTMMTMTNGDVTMAHGDYHTFVAQRLLVPQSRPDYAIDLNGDGKTDNQLGNIVSALSSMSLNPQTAIDSAVTKGSVVILVSVQTTDMSLMSDDTAGGNLLLGTPFTGTAMPDFSGSGSFTVDSTQTPGHFFGKLSQGTFLSNNPVTTTHPVTVSLSLPLIDGVAPLQLHVNGAHMKFQSTGCPMDPDTGMAPAMCGELHGSIKKSDIDMTIIPAVAVLLTQKVMMGGSTAQQIQSIFDTGGCTNPDGSMAMAMDGKIDICEVSQNGLIANLLAPDIQVFAADGVTYMPNKNNTMKDSMSLGLGFDLVKGSFPQP